MRFNLRISRPNNRRTIDNGERIKKNMNPIITGLVIFGRTSERSNHNLATGINKSGYINARSRKNKQRAPYGIEKVFNAIKAKTRAKIIPTFLE